MFAVFTDNENKMKKMREILTTNHPKLLTYGCSSHYMNLAEKEIGTNVVVKHIVEVQKYFRNVHQARGWLENKGGLVPQLPNDTRRNSHLDTVKTFLSNYAKYLEIRSEEEEFSSATAKILDNIGILREANNLMKQLTAVGEALDKLQSDSVYLADAVETWLDVTENKDLEPHMQHFQRRADQALEPFHYLANMMHPKFMGRRLTPVQVVLIRNITTKNYNFHEINRILNFGTVRLLRIIAFSPLPVTCTVLLLYITVDFANC